MPTAKTIIDANYILRWFLNDIENQAQTVDTLLTNTEPAGILISRITIAEITYVLRSKQYDHRQIFQILDELYCYPSVREPGAVTKTALGVYRDTTLDFEDCTLIAYARVKGYAVGTFDKKMLRLLSSYKQ